jgi:formin-binding protein 1
MSWGTDLWDQEQLLGNYSQQGIEYEHAFGTFMRTCARAELQFVGEVTRAVQNFRSETQRRTQTFASTQLQAIDKLLAEMDNAMAEVRR